VFAKSSSKVGSNIEYKYEWREGERGRSGEGIGGKGKGRGKGQFCESCFMYATTLV